MLSHSCKRISVAMTLPHPKALRVMADSPASAEPEVFSSSSSRPPELFVTSSTLFKHAASISRHPSTSSPSNAPPPTGDAPPVFPRRRLVLDNVPLGSLAAPTAAKPPNSFLLLFHSELRFHHINRKEDFEDPVSRQDGAADGVSEEQDAKAQVGGNSRREHGRGGPGPPLPVPVRRAVAPWPLALDDPGRLAGRTHSR